MQILWNKVEKIYIIINILNFWREDVYVNALNFTLDKYMIKNHIFKR